MRKKGKKDIFNFLSLYFLQGVNILYPLIVIPFLSFGLGVDQMGQFMLHQSLVLIGFSIVEYGFNYSASREIVKHIESRYFVSRIFSETIFAKLLISLFVFLLSLLVSISDAINLWLVLSFFPMVLGGVFFPIWYFQAKQKMHLIAFPHALAKVAGVGLVYFCINSPEEIYLAAFLVSITYVLSAVISAIFIFYENEIDIQKVGFVRAWKVISQSRELALGTVLNGFYSNAGMVVLGWSSQASDKMLASVGLGVKIKNSMPAINQPFNQILYVKIAKYYEFFKRFPVWFVGAFLFQMAGVALIFSVLLFFSDEISIFFIGVRDEFDIVAFFIVAGALSVIRMSLFLQVGCSVGRDDLLAKAGFFQFPLFLMSYVFLRLVFDDVYAVIFSYIVVDVIALVYFFMSILVRESKSEKMDN